ncbi:hypothetical protein [Phaffia rhodozyma]|uniref:Uncharacterized protein n=1 Tax=Phaffia rhodozyma TaxID=264483 RepID=A0A0F7SPC5_PHARH|nr:hypothetical protein [Phaffia rhodozyma]
MQYTFRLVPRLTIQNSSQVCSTRILTLSSISKRSYHPSLCSSNQGSTSTSTTKPSSAEGVIISELQIQGGQDRLKKRTSSIKLNIPVLNLKDLDSLASISIDGRSISSTGLPKKKKVPPKKSPTDALESVSILNDKLSNTRALRIFKDFKRDLTELANKCNSPAQHPNYKDLNKMFRDCLNAIYLDSAPDQKKNLKLLELLRQRSIIIYGGKVSTGIDPAIATRIASISDVKELQPVLILTQSGSPGFQWSLGSEPPIVDSTDNPSPPSSSSSSSSDSTPLPSLDLPKKICVQLPADCPYIIIFLTRSSARETYVQDFNSLPENIADQTYAGIDSITYERFLLNFWLTPKPDKV